MHVIDSLFNAFWGCRHRRTTFPLTPVKRPGEEDPSLNETYVVCLNCGKQFVYDWEQMRLGKAVDISDGVSESSARSENVPFKTKSKLRYLFWASAVPAAWAIRNAVKSRKRRLDQQAKDGEDGRV